MGRGKIWMQLLIFWMAPIFGFGQHTKAISSISWLTENRTTFLSPEQEKIINREFKMLLQHQEPLVVIDEVITLYSYLKQTSHFQQPSLLLAYFNKVLSSHSETDRDAIVKVGMSFSSLLLSQKNLKEAEEILRAIAHSKIPLTPTEIFEFNANNAFLLDFTGLVDSAMSVALQQVKALSQDTKISRIEKSRRFAEYISIFTTSSAFETADSLFFLFKGHHKNSMEQAAVTVEEKNHLEWIYLTTGLQVYSSSPPTIESAKPFYDAIVGKWRNNEHLLLARHEGKGVFNKYINYAIELRMDKQTVQAKSVNQIGVKMATDLGYFEGISGLYGNLAYLGIDENKPEDTYMFAKEAIAAGRHGNVNQLPNYYSIFAVACVRLEKINEAKSAIQQAISLFLKTPITWEELPNLRLEDIANQEFTTLAYALESIGYSLSLLSDIDGNKEFLSLAHHFFNLGAQVYPQITHLASSATDMNFLYNTIHEGLLNTCLLLQDCPKEEVLEIAEKNKSLTQLQHLLFSDLNFGTSITNSDLLELKSLQRNMLQLHQKNLEETILTDFEKKELRSSMTSIQNEIEAWQMAFNTKNPQFKALFNQTFNVSEIKASLKQDEALLRYFIFEDLAFLYEITSAEVTLFFLGNRYNLEADVVSYLSMLKNPSSDFFPQAVQIFEALLPNWQPLADKRKLFIIPDGKLHQLPFEAIVSKPEKQFLVEQKEISYFRNATNFLHSKKKGMPKTGDFFVYSPSYQPLWQNGRNQQAAQLPGAEKEARSIDQNLSPILRQGQAANKQNFFLDSKTANLIHIAAHAVVEDNGGPHFVFTDDKLFFEELYAQDISADLVVLSACNTGISSLPSDDSFLSLGQAFSFAGVNALVYTLWSVPDEQSAFVMEAFYNYLANGKAKSTALTEGKKAFLSKANSHERHPYYWAGFVLQGNGEPLQITKTFPFKKWILGAFVLLLIVGGLSYTIRRKSS